MVIVPVEEQSQQVAKIVGLDGARHSLIQFSCIMGVLPSHGIEAPFKNLFGTVHPSVQGPREDAGAGTHMRYFEFAHERRACGVFLARKLNGDPIQVPVSYFYRLDGPVIQGVSCLCATTNIYL